MNLETRLDKLEAQYGAADTGAEWRPTPATVALVRELLQQPSATLAAGLPALPPALQGRVQSEAGRTNLSAAEFVEALTEIATLGDAEAHARLAEYRRTALITPAAEALWR